MYTCQVITVTGFSIKFIPKKASQHISPQHMMVDRGYLHPITCNTPLPCFPPFITCNSSLKGEMLIAFNNKSKPHLPNLSMRIITLRFELTAFLKKNRFCSWKFNPSELSSYNGFLAYFELYRFQLCLLVQGNKTELKKGSLAVPPGRTNQLSPPRQVLS